MTRILIGHGWHDDGEQVRAPTEGSAAPPHAGVLA
ncbi:hypothetical protein H4W32_000880 [Actinophytocola algeriensis]|uniref:Uncharacterized protein n=1 Tax=Actinophytocola algeriensis TaxID=1768010 RepID=A0A7W7Q1U6_9PSEU|nr:hypothetical protein [Actinophytocola algeriensis]MBE1472838.1 hypothetical protein [Actinophytocola algeriensis]